MRLAKLCLMMGTALVTAAPLAQAADWDRGTYKSGGAIPVPAPIPIVETFKWYLRADVGGGVSIGPDVSTSSGLYGLDRDPAEGTSFGASSSWFSGDFTTFVTGGIGAGAYLSPRMRADVTLDFRTKQDSHTNQSYSYTGDPTIYTAGPTTIDGQSRDRVQTENVVALANLYWDLADRGSRWVPYVGAGLGFAVRSVDRNHSTTETLYDTTDPLNPVATGSRTFEGNGKAHKLALAASATAGVAYTISPGMVLDLSYRYTYLGGVEFSQNIAYSQPVNGQTGASSKMTVGDTHEQAIRAGIRWNIW